jgi:parallel beta-helix repeat protein
MFIELGKPPYSMVVYKKNDKYFARDGSTGNVYSGTDAADVIQWAIDNVPPPGGTILIKRGDYYLSRAVRITKHINLVGEGVGATRLFLAPDANSRMIEYCIDPAVVSTYGVIQPHMYIAHMLLHGNKEQQTSGSEAIVTHAEGDCDRVADWLLFNVWITRYKGHGVRVRTTHNWLILHSSIEHGDGDAVRAEGADEGMVGFSLLYNNQSGVYISNIGSPIRIIGNRIAVFRHAAISINSSSFVIASGNFIHAAGVNPDYCVYINNSLLNIFSNNIIRGTARPNYYYIYIRDSSHNTISNNVMDAGIAYIVDYTIYEDGASNNNIIENNNILNANIDGIRLVGTRSQARYNYARIGAGADRYPTIRSGVAVITAGNTRVTVSHGLYKAPAKVLITPIGQTPGKLWVENITGTSFDIVTDTAPTASLNVAWYAEV